MLSFIFTEELIHYNFKSFKKLVRFSTSFKYSLALHAGYLKLQLLKCNINLYLSFVSRHESMKIR